MDTDTNLSLAISYFSE